MIYSNIVIFTDTVTGYGGSQLLNLRRAKYLHKEGSKVFLVYRRITGAFFLEKEYDGVPLYYNPVIDIPISLVSNKKKQILVDEIKAFIGDTDNVIVESQSPQEAVWAEYFANAIKAKHYLYFYDSDRVDKYIFYPGSSFFFFKLDRKEFYAVSPQCLYVSLSGKGVDKNNDFFINVSYNEAELLKDTRPHIEFESNDYDFVISTVSRLEKSYIVPLIKDAISYARIKDKRVLLIIGGDSVIPHLEENLRKEYEGQKGCTKIVFLGHTHPGKDLFEISNVFVGTGTAAISAVSQGCPALIYNLEQPGETYGYFGVEVNDIGYGGVSYSILDAFDKITDIEFEKNLRSRCKTFFELNFSMRACENKRERLLTESNSDFSFYSFKPSICASIIDCLSYIILQTKVKMARLFVSFRFIFNSKV